MRLIEKLRKKSEPPVMHYEAYAIDDDDNVVTPILKCTSTDMVYLSKVFVMNGYNLAYRMVEGDEEE